MKDFIIGIDPGRNGGIVGLTNGKVNTIDKMPLKPADIWGYFIDVLGIPMMKERNNIYVFIESVHSMPTDGVKSAFSFGQHLGWLDMLLAYYDLHTERVLPRTWQESFSIPTRKTSKLSKYDHKKYIKNLAKVHIPNHQEEKITMATCDAYLIAVYGYNQRKESND